MLPYLKRCVRSVADQREDVQHLVMDGGSIDGTVEWLRGQPGVRAQSERDRGMYDALNKGLALARGEIVSYLNCDEQYLPGALAAVKEHFAANPAADVVFGDALLIAPDGGLLAFRKGYRPRWPYIVASHLYVLSCTMFFRRRIVDSGFRFDDTLRDVADADFVVRLLRAGYRADHMRRYLAAFTMTGANMSAGANAQREIARARDAAPSWVRALRGPINAARMTEKVVSGAYRQRFPLAYSVYSAPEALERTTFQAPTSTFRWPKG